MKTILVPLDGSTLAEQALPPARLLARTLPARLRLLRVISDLDREEHIAEGIAALYGLSEEVAESQERRRERLHQIMYQNAEAYLAARLAELRADQIEADIDVRAGQPADVIVEAAEHKQVAAIVMATHGYSGVKRWALGSVADKIIRATSTPVLIVRGIEQPRTTPGKLEHILVPLDGSELSLQALPPAVELATAARARVTLLQAVVPVMEAAIGVPLLGRTIGAGERALHEAQTTAQELAHARLAAVAGSLNCDRIALQTHVALGPAADVIVDEAERLRADLIVMATHGYSGVRRWALGSVADKVLHATSTPLMLVRAR